MRERAAGSTCRWKPLWIEEAVLFDESAGEAVLAVRSERSRGRPGGDRERQRPGFERCVRAEKAAAVQRRSGMALATTWSSGDAVTRIPHEEFVVKPVRSWRDGVNRVLHPRQGRRKAFLAGESSGSLVLVL